MGNSGVMVLVLIVAGFSCGGLYMGHLLIRKLIRKRQQEQEEAAREKAEEDREQAEKAREKADNDRKERQRREIEENERKAQRRSALEATEEGRTHLSDCAHGNHEFYVLSQETITEGGRYEIDSHGDSDYASYGYTEYHYKCKYCETEETEHKEYDNTNDDAYQIGD